MSPRAVRRRIRLWRVRRTFGRVDHLAEQVGMRTGPGSVFGSLTSVVREELERKVRSW